jgi:hypothetical protein
LEVRKIKKRSILLIPLLLDPPPNNPTIDQPKEEMNKFLARNNLAGLMEMLHKNALAKEANNNNNNDTLMANNNSIGNDSNNNNKEDYASVSLTIYSYEVFVFRTSRAVPLATRTPAIHLPTSRFCKR